MGVWSLVVIYLCVVWWSENCPHLPKNKFFIFGFIDELWNAWLNTAINVNRHAWEQKCIRIYEIHIHEILSPNPSMNSMHLFYVFSIDGIYVFLTCVRLLLLFSFFFGMLYRMIDKSGNERAYVYTIACACSNALIRWFFIFENIFIELYPPKNENRTPDD